MRVQLDRISLQTLQAVEWCLRQIPVHHGFPRDSINEATGQNGSSARTLSDHNFCNGRMEMSIGGGIVVTRKTDRGLVYSHCKLTRLHFQTANPAKRLQEGGVPP